MARLGHVLRVLAFLACLPGCVIVGAAAGVIGGACVGALMLPRVFFMLLVESAPAVGAVEV